MRRAPPRPARALCESGALFMSKNMTGKRQRRNFNATPSGTLLSKDHALHTAPSTLHTSSHFLSFEISSPHLISSHLISSHLSSKFFSTIYIPADHCSTFHSHLMEAFPNSSALLCVRKLLLSVLPSTTSCYKGCTKHFRVPLCTTTPAQNTVQYYFVLQSLHEVRPSTTCATRLAQSTCQYYFVLQELHETRPSTTSYKNTELAQSTSQPYFVLHDLHKLLQNRILAPKRQKADFEALFQRIFYRKITSAKLEKSLLTNQPRNLDAATPIRFTMPSCKRPLHHAHSRNTKEPSCSHHIAICKRPLANTKKEPITCVKVRCYHNITMPCQAQNEITSAMQSAFSGERASPYDSRPIAHGTRMRKITATIKSGSCCYVRCQPLNIVVGHIWIFVCDLLAYLRTASSLHLGYGMCSSEASASFLTSWAPFNLVSMSEGFRLCGTHLTHP